MQTIKINVYSFDELPPEAKEKALEIYRDFNVEHSFWYESVYDDFIALCETIGIEVYKKKIFFSGFWSQGDGSTFAASINILQFINAVETKAWKGYAPNLELEITPFRLDSRIKSLIENGTIDSWCAVRNPNRGYWTNTDTSFNYSYNRCKNYRRIDGHLDLLEEWIEAAIKTLNRCLYKSLEEQYEYETSDEVVTEVIRCNDFRFTLDGKQAERLLNLEAITQD